MERRRPDGRMGVVEAVQSGKFHVYAIESVDQGMEILTGVPAGERDGSGQFPSDSVNGRVEKRLIEFAKKRLALALQAKGENTQE